MQLPSQISDLIKSTPDPNVPAEKIKKQKKQRIILITLAAIAVLLVFLILILFLASQTSRKTSKTIQESDPKKALEKSQKEKEEASRSATEAAKPLNRLQKAFDEIIGSNSLKKNLTINSSGLAEIAYVISSTDGTFIIKTSYENFADFATKVFNISDVQKLSISSYTTKFVDQYGQPNQVALKLEITRETNDKVNWAVKKYAYKDYPTILTTHQINSNLSKDYENLLKSLKS